MATIQCTGCQTQYPITPQLAGMRVRCKRCGAVLQVPGLAELDPLRAPVPRSAEPVSSTAVAGTIVFMIGILVTLGASALLLVSDWMTAGLIVLGLGTLVAGLAGGLVYLEQKFGGIGLISVWGAGAITTALVLILVPASWFNLQGLQGIHGVVADAPPTTNPVDYAQKLEQANYAQRVREKAAEAQRRELDRQQAEAERATKAKARDAQPVIQVAQWKVSPDPGPEVPPLRLFPFQSTFTWSASGTEKLPHIREIRGSQLAFAQVRANRPDTTHMDVLWNFGTGEKFGELRPTENRGGCLAWESDKIFSHGPPGQLKVQSLPELKPLENFQLAGPRSPDILYLGPQNQILVLDRANPQALTLEIYTSSAQPPKVLPLPPHSLLFPETGSISISQSPGWRYVALRIPPPNDDGYVARSYWVLDMQQGVIAGEFKVRGGAETFVSFSPDGKELAIFYRTPPQMVVLIDLATGKATEHDEAYPTGSGRSGHGHLTWSPDGRRLLFYDEKSWIVFDKATKKGALLQRPKNSVILFGELVATHAADGTEEVALQRWADLPLQERRSRTSAPK